MNNKPYDESDIGIEAIILLCGDTILTGMDDNISLLKSYEQYLLEHESEICTLSNSKLLITGKIKSDTTKIKSGYQCHMKIEMVYSCNAKNMTDATNELDTFLVSYMNTNRTALTNILHMTNLLFQGTKWVTVPWGRPITDKNYKV